MHSDQWIADQILEMGRLAEATARAAARAAVQEEFSRLWSAADEAGRKRLIRQFAETGRVDRELSQAIQSGALPQQLSRWQILTESPDPGVAQAATLRIIDALAVPDWVKEARRRFAELPAAEQWPPELRPNYEATRQKLEGVVDLHSESGPSGWAARSISSGSVTPPRSRFLVVGCCCTGSEEAVPRARRVSTMSMTLDCDRYSLRGDGSLYWEMKLATNEINPIDEEAPIVHAAGLNLYLMHMEYCMLSHPSSADLFGVAISSWKEATRWGGSGGQSHVAPDCMQ